MVNVTHNGNNRRTRLYVTTARSNGILQVIFNLSIADQYRIVTHLFNN